MKNQMLAIMTYNIYKIYETTITDTKKKKAPKKIFIIVIIKKIVLMNQYQS